MILRRDGLMTSVNILRLYLPNYCLKKERNMIVEYERYASRSLSEKGKFAFQWLFIDLLFIQKEIKALITEKDIMEFNVIFAENHSFRKKNPEIFTGMDSISESLLCKNGILVGNNTRFYTPEYESVTIYTPKGSIVPGAVKLSNEDVVVSPAMEAQLRAHLISAYDSAQVIDPGSYKYSAEGWTWHTSETGEKVVIPYHNDAVYISDGSYIQVPEQIATKVIYGSNNNFSATIESSNWYISKWGYGGPLVRHHPTSLPDGTDTFWSPENLNYYPLGQKTYYMRNPGCTVTGPVWIASGYGTYTIQNLPSGTTVSWSLSDNYYNTHNCLISNYPSMGQCLIVRDQNHNLINDTLTAIIKYNNVPILTVKKSGIYAYAGFYGHYSSADLSGDIDYTLYFNVRTNTGTTVYSPNFYGATVTYDSSGATPTGWGFHPDTGVLDFTTATPGAAVVIKVIDGCGNNYTLYAYATNQYRINVSSGEGGITVSLVEDGDSDRNISVDQPWTVEVRNVTTGQMMATRSSTSRSETISTVGWPKGIYVVKATIGEEELTEKVIVK